MSKMLWSEEELLILWLRRFDNTNKELAELLGDKTPKAVRHITGGFKQVTEEDEAYIKENISFIYHYDIDDHLNLPKGTSSRYARAFGLKYVMRKNGITKYEVDTLKKYQDTHTYNEIADMLGTTEPRIRNLASNLGLWKKFEWTESKVNKVLSLLDSGKTLEETGNEFGKSAHSIRVMLNLKGHYDYLPFSIDSPYHASGPEEYIMNYLSNEFGVVFPKKNRENKDYYWGIIPPYEVDIPFELNGHKFAIEHDATYWHSDAVRISNDIKKEKLLKEKGYYYFVITDKMYKKHKIESMDPVLKKICDQIKQIIY